METPNKNKAPEPAGIDVRVDALVMPVFTIYFQCQNPAYEEVCIEEKTHIAALSEDDAWKRFLAQDGMFCEHFYTRVNIHPRRW